MYDKNWKLLLAWDIWENSGTRSTLYADRIQQRSNGATN